jgi:adenosine kinase
MNEMNGNFHRCSDTPTGTCAVLVVKKERTLCANLAAACKYSSDHLNANMDVLKTAKIIYSTSFFITSNKEALLSVANYASQNNIPFGYNLSVVFLLHIERDTVFKAMEHSDYLFANEDEAAEFGKIQNIEGGLREVAIGLAKWKKTNLTRPRYAIVT